MLQFKINMQKNATFNDICRMYKVIIIVIKKFICIINKVI